MAQRSLSIRNFPKVLLHTHLEGSIPQSTLNKLCKRNKIELPFPVDSKAVKEICRKGQWPTFLRLYLLISSCFRNRFDFYDVVCDYANHLFKENIIYAELTCTPWNHYSRGVSLDDIARGLYDGIETANRRYGIDLKIIFDVVRSPQEDVDLLITWMSTLPRTHFVGLGFSGGPESIPYECFRSHCDKARQAGFKIVAHAGELENAESVRKVVQDLNVDRVSHGVRLLEDRDLLDTLIAKNLHFELCATSNEVLGVGRSHFASIHAMLSSGAKCSINTDDDFFFSTCLTKEFETLINEQIIEYRDLAKITDNAIRAAFTDNASRARLLSKIDEACKNSICVS